MIYGSFDVPLKSQFYTEREKNRCARKRYLTFFFYHILNYNLETKTTTRFWIDDRGNVFRNVRKETLWSKWKEKNRRKKMKKTRESKATNGIFCVFFFRKVCRVMRGWKSAKKNGGWCFGDCEKTWRFFILHIIKMAAFLWMHDTRVSVEAFTRPPQAGLCMRKYIKHVIVKGFFFSLEPLLFSSPQQHFLVLNFILVLCEVVVFFSLSHSLDVFVRVGRAMSFADLWCEHCTSISHVLCFFLYVLSYSVVSFPQFRLCAGIVLSLEIRCAFAISTNALFYTLCL